MKINEKDILLSLEISNQTKTNITQSSLHKFITDVKRIALKKDFVLICVEKNI